MCREMQRYGRLHHAWRHGRLKHPATLDDHADMAAAALALHEATGKADTLAQAERWVALLDRHYWDDATGGYLLTADDTPDPRSEHRRVGQERLSTCISRCLQLQYKKNKKK